MKRKICRSIIIIFAVLPGSVFAKINPVLQNAEQLALAGEDNNAITEYQRYLFFTPDSPSVEIQLILSELYRKTGQLDNAQKALLYAISSTTCDSLRYVIRIQYSLIDLAQGRFFDAQMELLRISSFSRFISLRNQATLLLCIAYILSDEWDLAKRTSAVGVLSGDLRFKALDSLLKTTPRFSRKSPLAAKCMSSVLPGLGQVYAHDVRSGLNAFAISAATSLMIIYSIVYGYYQEALAVDIAIFWRYYSGNRYNAARAADRFNDKQNRALKNEVLRLLSGKKSIPESKKTGK